jgi:DNA end-binding protein Ku
VARPFWSGQLQISLVSFGIDLFPATNPASEISFHQIDRKTGQRVHHQNVVDDDEPVEKDEIVKGYEYKKGQYIAIEPDEVQRLRIATKRTLEVAQFVDLDQLPPALFEKPYFVVPHGEGQMQAYAVVRDAMKKTKKAAVGEIAFSGREHLVAIVPAPGAKSKGMMAYTLRYGAELRDEKDYFGDIKAEAVDAKQLAMATDLIEHYSGNFELDRYKDDYESALKRLIEAKMKKQPLPLEDKAPKKAKVINLMDALRQSMEADGKPGKRGSRARLSGDHDQSVARNRGLKLVKPVSRKRKSA